MLSPGSGVKPSLPTGKTFSLGPRENPEQIKVKWDDTTNQWKYFNAKAGEVKTFSSLEELMNANPTVFYK
jgi:hypothetical protein